MKKIIALCALIVSCFFTFSGCLFRDEPQVMIQQDTFVYDINHDHVIEKTSISIEFDYTIENKDAYEIVFYIKGYTTDNREVWNYEEKIKAKRTQNETYDISIYEWFDEIRDIATIKITNVTASGLNNSYTWIAILAGVVSAVLLAGIIVFIVISIKNKKNPNGDTPNVHSF